MLLIVHAIKIPSITDTYVCMHVWCMHNFKKLGKKKFAAKGAINMQDVTSRITLSSEFTPKSTHPRKYSN